jgi:hypothetical protein
MSIRTTTATAFAVLALTLTACSSSGSGGGDDKLATSATSSTASPSPTIDRAAARQACINQWVDLLEADSASAENEPAVCKQIPGKSAEMYAEALRQRNEANRKPLDDCLEDPSCTALPVP